MNALTASTAIPLPSAPVLCELHDPGVLRIEGADAQSFLQGQLSNDVRALRPGAWQHTTYNSPKGRMLANMVLWAEDSGYYALLPGEIAEATRKRLAMYVLRSKVTVEDRTAGWRVWGVAGERATEALQVGLGDSPAMGSMARAEDARVLAVATGCFLIAAPRDAAEAILARLRPHTDAGDDALWQWLMIRAGIPTITAATQDAFVLQTTNLDALGGVSFEKGCYTGQEIIARTQYLGRLKERLFPWHTAEADVRPGARVFSRVFGEQACGTVVNAARAPQGGTDLLAVVQVAAADDGDVRLGSPDGAPLERLALPYALPQPTPHARPKL